MRRRFAAVFIGPSNDEQCVRIDELFPLSDRINEDQRMFPEKTKLVVPSLHASTGEEEKRFKRPKKAS